MAIPVVLKDGNERVVSKDYLQYLLTNRQILFFERTEGWVVVGRDRFRQQDVFFAGEERRESTAFAIERQRH